MVDTLSRKEDDSTNLGDNAINSLGNSLFMIPFPSPFWINKSKASYKDNVVI